MDFWNGESRSSPSMRLVTLALKPSCGSSETNVPNIRGESSPVLPWSVLSCPVLSRPVPEVLPRYYYCRLVGLLVLSGIRSLCGIHGAVSLHRLWASGLVRAGDRNFRSYDRWGRLLCAWGAGGGGWRCGLIEADVAYAIYFEVLVLFLLARKKVVSSFSRALSRSGECRHPRTVVVLCGCWDFMVSNVDALILSRPRNTNPTYFILTTSLCP